MAKGLERNAPKAARALRQLATASTALGRAERARAKVDRDNEKQRDRIRQINDELAKQDREAIETSNKKSRIQRREERQRRRRTRDMNEEANLTGTLIGLQREHAKAIDKTTQFRLNLQEIKRKNDLLDEKERLSKQQLIDLEDKLRNRQREDSRRGEQIKQMTKDREVLRGQLGRTTAILNRHESTLSDLDKEAVARGKERNRLLDEESTLRDKSTQRTEASTRAADEEARATRNRDNALSAYNGTLDDNRKKVKKHGNEMNLVGRMLTDLPFVPGGKAGAFIGGGVVMVLASVAEAAVTASQSLAVLPAIAAAGGAAFGTLALGLSGFGQALQNMGPYGSDPKQFAQALAGMAPAAQQAALEIQALTRGPLGDLKKATQENLFAGIPEMLHNATYTFLPAIQQLTGGLSTSMNNMFGNILGQLATPDSMKSLENIINNIVTAFQKLEPAVAPFVSALTKITETGSTFLPGFAEAVTNAANAFNNWITKAQEDGSLQNFIQKGIDAVVGLKNMLVELGRRIFDTFGNRSVEDWKNTLNTVVDTVMSVINAVTSLADFLNDVLGPIEAIAKAIGGWEKLIWLAAGAFTGFKLIGLGAATQLSAAFATAGTGAGLGFAGKLSTAMMGFGWAAVGAAIAIPIISAIDNSIKNHKFDAAPNVYGGQSGTMTPWQWMNRAQGDELQRRQQYLKENMPGWTSQDLLDKQFTPPWDAPNQPGSFGDYVSQLPAVRPGYNGPHGTQGPPGSPPGLSVPLPPGAPGYSPQDVPGVPPDGAGSASKRKDELENQLARDPRFAVDPFAPIAGMPGISPQPGAGGPGGIEYRQPNPYEKGSFGTYIVDPVKVGRELNDVKQAAREFGDAQRELAVAEQLRKENLINEAELIQAQQARDDKEQSFIEARQDLVKAERGTFDKLNNGTKNLKDINQQIGAKIDDDFGVSKGLPGIFENLFKVIANMAMAPVLGALTGVTAAYGTAGPGTGLLGMFYRPETNQDGSPKGKYPGDLTQGYSPTGSSAIGGDRVSAMLALAQGASGKTRYGPASDLVHGLADCSGSVSDLVEMLQTGTTTSGRLFDTTNFATDAGAAKLGFLPGYMPGALNVGVNPYPGNSGHMAATLPNGVNFEGGGGTGGGAQYGGSASGALDPQFQKHYYLPLGNSGTLPADMASDPLASGPLSGSGGGVVPVFVTNMGSGGLNGPATPPGAPGQKPASGPGSAPPGSGGGPAPGQVGPDPGPGGSWRTNADGSKTAIDANGNATGGYIPPGGGKPAGLVGPHGDQAWTHPTASWWQKPLGSMGGRLGGGSSGGAIPATGTGPHSGGIGSLFGHLGIGPTLGLPGDQMQIGGLPDGPMAGYGISNPLIGGGAVGLPLPPFAAVPGGMQGTVGNGAVGGPMWSPWAGGDPGTGGKGYLGGPGGLPLGPPDLSGDPGAFPFTGDNAPGGESFVPGTQPFGQIGPTGTSYTPAFGRMYAEGKPSSPGLGVGGGILGAAMGAGGGALNMMAPGAGIAAQIGIDEINRAIQAGAQIAGIGVEGLMETFLPVESELADPSRGWFGRILGAVASVKPVAKNISGLLGGPDTAGQPGQPDQQPGQGDQPLSPEQVAAQKAQDAQNQPGQPPPNVNVNVDNTKAPEALQTQVTQPQIMANSMPGGPGR